MTPSAMDGEPMPSMATATCGAEYMALSLAVKELIWIYMLLKTIGVKVEKPCIVYEDNRSTMKIAENATALKHIDIRYPAPFSTRAHRQRADQACPRGDG